MGRLLAGLNELAFAGVYHVGLLLLRIVFRYEVVGAPDLPRGSPAILVANHTSFLDPIVLQGATRRRIRFVMLQSFYDIWFLRWFFRLCRAIPLRDTGINTDRWREVIDALDRGEVVGIFPEGEISRDGSLQRGRPGVASLFLRGVPIHPAAIEGTFEALPRHARMLRPARIRVIFGAPILPQDVQATAGPDRRTRLRNLTDRVMEGIRAAQESGRASSRPRETRTPKLPGG